MAILNLQLPYSHSLLSSSSKRSSLQSKPQARRKISCIGWDPEGVLGAPKGGHIARLEFKKRLEKDAGAREAFERQLKEEEERRRAIREARVIPDTKEGLVEYFLDTEARELEFEVSRLRPRLNKEFFDHIKLELGQLRFAVSKTPEVEDRVIELEAMQNVLTELTVFQMTRSALSKSAAYLVSGWGGTALNDADILHFLTRYLFQKNEEN